MFTRTKDKDERIRYDLDVLTQTNNYTFKTPGNGLDVPYIETPNVRLQKWGANMRTNAVNIEHDLFGQTRRLNRDIGGVDDFCKHTAASEPKMYSSKSIKQSNTLLDDNKLDKKERTIEQLRKNQILLEDPQRHINLSRGISTRYEAKYKVDE